MNHLKLSETQIRGRCEVLAKKELRRRARVNESLILMTYYFTSVCLPLLRGPCVLRLFGFQTCFNNRLAYCSFTTDRVLFSSTWISRAPRGLFLHVCGTPFLRRPRVPGYLGFSLFKWLTHVRVTPILSRISRQNDNTFHIDCTEKNN